MESQFLLLVLLFLATAIPLNSGDLYPIEGVVIPGDDDDGSSNEIQLTNTFDFFGQTYSQIYVNLKGHLTFQSGWDEGTITPFPMYGSRDIIAPFWSDLDNSEHGQVTYYQSTSDNIIEQATTDIHLHFPALNFQANWVFVATWDEVAHQSDPDARITFQVVLISGGLHSFILMNYGSITSSIEEVQSGYDTIDSVQSFLIPGLYSDYTKGSNVDQPGRWAFQTDLGPRQCIFNEKTVQLGDSFWTDSTCAKRCTCIDTGLECQDQPCSYSEVCQQSAFQFSCEKVEKKSCFISGLQHYNTFDGTTFQFKGSCTYVLSEQCGKDLPYYRVEGRNHHGDNTPTPGIRRVKVYVHDETIEFVRGRHGEAKVNGEFMATPIFLNSGTIQIYESGFSLIVSTYFGLEVSYDTNRYITVRVPQTYQDATCGLCGTFNNNPEDDLQNREGQIVSSELVFANSWIASGVNEPDCRTRCGGLDCVSCNRGKLSSYRNNGHCGILKRTSGPFAACHQQLPPQAFVESCVYDLCEAEGQQLILCQALNEYARQCQHNGIQVENWRKRDFCETTCPTNSHFEFQGTGCPATCDNRNSMQNCPRPAQESCICDSDYYLSAGTCVPLAECGCSFEGLYYRKGQTVILDEDCGRRCTCSNGLMTCDSHGCGPLESCRVVEGERICQSNSVGTCRIRGPGLYNTFDGVKYWYSGACRLTLAKVIESSSHPHFMVTAEKVPKGQRTFTPVLKFEAEGTHVSIEQTQNSRVHVNGQQIRLPFSSASNGIQIYRSSIYSIVIHTSFGVTVQTVWPHFIRVTVPGIYGGSLVGLCGDYNGNPNDDFSTPNGMLVSSSQDFADSWRRAPLSPHCRGQDPNPTLSNTYTESCAWIAATQRPFTQCWSSVDPQPHMDACVEIIRASTDPASALCEALRDYVLMCQQGGVSLAQWRTTTGCEQDCPPNSHYELCGNSCESRCPGLSELSTCDTECQEGCQCDNGFVLNDNQCVPPTSCGCYHQGRYLQSDEEFWDGDECQSLCVCYGPTGAVQCTPSSCGPREYCGVEDGVFGCHPDPRGTCSASGDPHYVTYDGKTYDFQGTCRYVLSTPCNGTESTNQFSVEAKNEAWRGSQVSITAEVYVNVWGYEVQMSRHNSGMVMVNGITRNLPVVLNGGQVSIYANGFRTFVISDFGLSVTYDGRSTVSIALPSDYRGQTCGLCGNFNGNSNDEFRIRSGMMVTTPQEFGSAWKVQGNYICSDGCGSSCPQCADEQPARAKCDVIQAVDGPFSFCHEQVDPVPYFNDCVFDVCVSGDEGEDLLCRAIEAYVSACQSANVQIDPWRNTICRADCPANSHYEMCATDCGHTCSSSTDASCGGACHEGCFCDEGFRKSGTQCIPADNCGCEHDGFYYNAGESFWKEGCSERCECHASNDLRCSAASCAQTESCTLRNGQLACLAPMSTCTVFGDPHYHSFDGLLVHFQGTCSYIITESVGNSDTEIKFQVVASNSHRGNNRVSFVSAVDIYLSRQSEDSHIRIGPNRRVKVDGGQVSLPSNVGTLAQVKRQGSYIIVHADDLIVKFDGQSTLLVSVGQDRENRVTGMCGNFNFDSTDDKVFPDGTLAPNDIEFGHSWLAPTSQPGCGSTDESLDDELSNCPCLDEYTELCSVISNPTGPFSACHLHSDPQPFFQSCIYDLCLYTQANGMLCSVVSAYERTCTELGLNIPEWRSPLQCAESDPCEHLDCSEYEWCGERDGEYGCFCDEHHHRGNTEVYDSSITCASSSGTMSISSCQLFEHGFHLSALHLLDDSCYGTLQDGRLVFHFDNDEQLCGTGLRSNGTHFLYENVIHGDVDPSVGLISRQRQLQLAFCCVYPLSQALSMAVGINPLESIVSKKLPFGQGLYQMTMTAYEDSSFLVPLTGQSSISMEINQRLYVAVKTEGVDERQISTVLDSCWATPVNDPNHPTRWDLIIAECPNPADSTVDLIQNGLSTVSQFSFRMFTFADFPSIYVHCHVHQCLLLQDSCSTHCFPGFHTRQRRDIPDNVMTKFTMGPLVAKEKDEDGDEDQSEITSSASPQVISMVTLSASFLTAYILK